MVVVEVADLPTPGTSEDHTRAATHTVVMVAPLTTHLVVPAHLVVPRMASVTLTAPHPVHPILHLPNGGKPEEVFFSW